MKTHVQQGAVASVRDAANEPADRTARKLLRKFLGERFTCCRSLGPGLAAIHVGPQDAPAAGVCGAGPALGTDGFAIRSSRGRLSIFGNTPRARLYGVCHLVDEVPLRRVGAGEWQIRRVPAFPIRQWSTMTLQANGGLPLGGNFDQSLEDLVAATKRAIVRAPHYGINALQLTGRGGYEGGIDIDWLIRYRRYPEVYQHYLRDVDRGRIERLHALREIGRSCHEHGLDLVIWNHELIMPAGLKEKILAAVRKEGLSGAAARELVRNKAEELFEEVPEVDTINLTLSEVGGGIKLLHRDDVNSGDPKAIAEAARHIRILLGAIWDGCRAYGKGLQVRSYNMTPHEQAVMRLALQDLPEEIVIMTKYTFVDFRGVEYEDNPLLGAFPRNRQIVEFTLTPECNGFGYVPALLPDFYQERLRRAQRRKLAGAVGRLDYHLQHSRRNFFTEGPPVMTFDTPNEFNIVSFSRCLWDPSSDVDALWKEWTAARYGAKLAPVAEKMLRQTQEITQRVFYVKGFHLLTHLNQPPALKTIDRELDERETCWRMMFMHENKKLRRAYDALRAASNSTIAACVKDKEDAEALCRSALRLLNAGRHLNRSLGGKELQEWFTRLEIAAGTFKQVGNLYFRLRQLRNRGIAGSEAHAVLAPHIRDFLEYCLGAERRIGAQWPLYRASRGVDVYEFPWHVIEDRSELPPAVLGRLERLWLALLEPLKPGGDRADGAPLVFCVPDEIAEMTVDGRSWRVRPAVGPEEIIPGSVRLGSPLALAGGERVLLDLRGRAGTVTVRKTRRQRMRLPIHKA
ncbi:MAG: hypothetical protein JXR37_02030 [Kiritimatiellae bacterium]|nr:hypothetical protein [Kiritimatiellia bacterium]